MAHGRESAFGTLATFHHHRRRPIATWEDYPAAGPGALPVRCGRAVGVQRTVVRK
jgi:hypothetical protein